MNKNRITEKKPFPHVGQRILKTAVAVFICLVICRLRGLSGGDMSTESAITAIICMQPYVRDTRDYAINRFAGSLLGAAWGLVLLVLLYAVPWLGRNPVVLYALMAAGVLWSLYSAALIRMPDSSSLAAIVFLCIVITYPEIDEPLTQAIYRIVDIFIGTAVAILVNIFRLPKEKHRERVFFIRTKDLVPDRFSQIPPAALFRLNYLYNDGAKICLMSEHAPAFFTLQMSAARLSVPLIVMDGAAIYDAAENVYLRIENILPASSAAVSRRLDELGISYFIYTVHKNKTCIFHSGNITEHEHLIYERMRRSPYRSYLEGEIYEDTEIVYFKIIGEDNNLPLLEERIRDGLSAEHLRFVIREQAAVPGLSGLYIFSDTATLQQAEKRLMTMLRMADPKLQPIEILLPDGYRSERDAMHLLQKISRYYEPVRLRRRKKG